jgi:hypothetical protein
MGYETKFDKGLKTLFCLCDCKTEVLVIEYDHELKLADLAIYKNFSSNRLSIWDRLRYAFRVFFIGKPYSDQIVLTEKQIKDIKKFCTEVLD